MVYGIGDHHVVYGIGDHCIHVPTNSDVSIFILHVPALIIFHCNDVLVFTLATLSRLTFQGTLFYGQVKNKEANRSFLFNPLINLSSL